MLSLALIAAAPLEPIQNWRIEAEQSFCMLSREFEADGLRVSIGFQPYEGGTTFDMTIVGPAAGAKNSGGDAKLSLGESATPVTARYVSTIFADNTQRLTQIRAPADVLQNILKGTTLTVQAGSQSLTLHVPPSAKAAAALNACQDELIKAIRAGRAGRLAADDPKVTVAAKLQPGRLSSVFGDPANYPDAARQANLEGRTYSILLVSGSGRVDQCVVEETPGTPLSEATCDLIRTIPFIPAKNATGATVPSVFKLRIGWKLPSG